MKKAILALIIMICIAQASYSQNNSSDNEEFTISGYIKDISSGETLFGASVFFNNISVGTITNEYGFFSITAPKGDYTLVVQYLGFVNYTQNISLESDQKINIALEEDTNQLDEVILIDDDTKKVNIRTPQMSVNKIKTSTIKQIPVVLGEVDVIKAIQLLPGVTNAGEGASGFNVRGGAEDQNLVLIDEGIIYNASHLFGFFSVFNADAIKDIKLYKGGIPAKFGGRASSVLDIRQKDGNKKDFHMNGGIGVVSSRLMAEGPLFDDKASFLVAGRGSYAHLFLKLMNNDNTAYFYDMNLKLNYDANENNKFFLSGYFGDDVIGINKLFSNTYGNISRNLRWNHIFSNKLFSNLSLIYSKYNYILSIDSIGLDWNSNIKNFNLKYDLGYYISDKFKLDFGISGIHYDFNPGEISPLNESSFINAEKLDRKKAFESGLYISAEHKISSKLTTQYGFRLSAFTRLGGQSLNEYINNQPVVFNEQLGIYQRGKVSEIRAYSSGSSIKTFSNLEPRIGLSYQLNGSSSIKASYNRMAQYLHLISNTTSATPLDIWAPSGKFIKPQIADQYAVGYFKNLKDDIFSLEVEAYYKEVENRIDYIDGADLIAQNTIETEILFGNSRAYGLEFLLKKNIGKLTGWLAYTLSKSEQRTLGGNAGGPGINKGNWYNTPYDRTHDISITTNYKLNEKWSFGGNFLFQTGRPVTYPNGQYQYQGMSIASYSQRNENRLPAYHRFDISATLTPRKNKDRNKNSQWVFSIYNLYNRQNAASITFSQNLDTGHNEAIQTSIFGIIPSVTYNFKF